MGEEDGCDRLLRKFVFSQWIESAEEPPSLTLSDLNGAIAVSVVDYSWFNFLILSLIEYRHGPKVRWTQGHKTRRLPDEALLTQAQPDLYLAISINSCQKLPEGLLPHKIHQNFTIESLSAIDGLIFSPSALPKAVALEMKHQVCFPFAVVETKHKNVPKSEIMKCYCQAANGSSTALSMLCELSKDQRGTRYWWGKFNEVLPIVSFTFIGPCVKLWLSYVSNYGCGDTEDKTSGRDVHQYVS